MAATKENFKRIPVWVMAIVFAMYVLDGCALFAPDSTPWHLLGPVGSFIQNFIKNDPDRIPRMMLNILGIHILEAVIAFFVTQWKGISGSARQKWILQTFVFGVFSLVPLIMFKPVTGKKIK